MSRSYRPTIPVQPIPFPTPSDGPYYKTLRPWQERCYSELGGKRWSSILGMPGSGKTTVQLVLAIMNIINSNFKHKVVVGCPKTLICQGFVRDGDQYSTGITLGGQNYDIVVDCDLSGDTSDSKTADLRHFMLTEPADCYRRAFELNKIISGCICVTTHAAIATVTSKATPEELQEMMKNTTFIIDEAHHLEGIFDALADSYTIIEGEDTTNALGRFVHAIVNKSEESTRLILATATPFRANRNPILYPEVRKRFSGDDGGMFVLPFLEHFSYISVNQIDLNYATYTVSPVDDILRQVAAEPEEYHLITIPGDIPQSWCNRTPGERERLFAGLRSIFGEDAVLDLVTADERRDQRKERLLAEPKRDRAGLKIKAVVAVYMVSEGVDWPACSRLHNSNCGKSLPNELQKIGRILRHFPGKHHVIATAYLRNPVATEDDTDTPGDIDVLNTALLVGMQYDDMCYPIFLPDDLAHTFRRKAADAESGEEGEGDEEGDAKDENPRSQQDSMYGLTLDVLFHHRMDEVNAMLSMVEPILIKDERNIGPVIANILEEFDVAPEFRKFAGDALRLKIVRCLLRKRRSIEHINMEYLIDLGFDRLVYREGLVTGSLYGCEMQEKDLVALRKLLDARIASLEAKKSEVYRAKTDPKYGSRVERKTVTRKVRRQLKRKIGVGTATPGERQMLTDLYPAQIEGL